MATYTGTFLADDVDEPWAEGIRAAAQAHFVPSAHRVAARHLASQRFADSVLLA